MKRLKLALLDLRAVVRLFFAEMRHAEALRMARDARAEVERLESFCRHTKAGLHLARYEAGNAALLVRRERERAAVGLR